MNAEHATEAERRRRLAHALRHPRHLVRSHDEAMALAWFVSFFGDVEYADGTPVWGS